MTVRPGKQEFVAEYRWFSWWVCLLLASVLSITPSAVTGFGRLGFAIAAVIWAVVGYLALTIFLNRTTIRATRESLRIDHGPLPVPLGSLFQGFEQSPAPPDFTVPVPTPEIRTLAIGTAETPDISGETIRTTSTLSWLQAVLHDGSEVRLAGGDEADRYVGWHLDRWLRRACPETYQSDFRILSPEDEQRLFEDHVRGHSPELWRLVAFGVAGVMWLAGLRWAWLSRGTPSPPGLSLLAHAEWLRANPGFLPLVPLLVFAFLYFVANYFRDSPHGPLRHGFVVLAALTVIGAPVLVYGFLAHLGAEEARLRTVEADAVVITVNQQARECRLESPQGAFPSPLDVPCPEWLTTGQSESRVKLVFRKHADGSEGLREYSIRPR